MPSSIDAVVPAPAAHSSGEGPPAGTAMCTMEDSGGLSVFLQMPLWKGSSMGGEIVVVVVVAKRPTVAVEVLLRAKNLPPSSGMDVSVAISLCVVVSSRRRTD